MSSLVTIGNVSWTREDMIGKLEEFSAIYASRPIKDNAGGMKSPHMFMAWFALQALKPKVIIESGVWYGQGTWLFEQACPEAEIYCIDINLKRVKYTSSRAKYLDKDFSAFDWTHLPKEETVLFFDDHQNAYERVKIAKWFGFKHLIFEDNYPASQGDCYSIKKVFMHSGFKFTPAPSKSLKDRLSRTVRGIFNPEKSDFTEIAPNETDAKYLQQNLDIYYEFPPVFKPELTRWNDRWEDPKYPTPLPLLATAEYPSHKIYFDEAIDYTWLTYAKLK